MRVIAGGRKGVKRPLNPLPKLLKQQQDPNEFI
jgi:hypothetical protein